MSAGHCRHCYNPSADSDICDRCMAQMDAQEDRPRPRQTFPVSTVRIPYDPEVDPF